MNKNTFTGLLLIGVILFGFTWYNSKRAARYQREKEIRDSIALVHQRLEEIPVLAPESFDSGIFEAAEGEPSGQDSLRMQQFGSELLSAQTGQETQYKLENDLISVTLSNFGGQVTDVVLKDYDRFDGEPVRLISPGSARFDLSFFILRGANNLQVNTGDYYFTQGPSAGNSLSLRLHVDSLSYLEYIYTLADGEYMVDFRMNFVNMENHLSNQYDILANWRSVEPRNEKGPENYSNYSSIFYRYPGVDSVEELGMSKSSKDATVNTRIHWIAFKQQFFSSIFIADTYFENAKISYDSFESGESILKRYNASIAIPFDKNQTQYGFRFYYGPNKYSLLKSYDIEAERVIQLGGWMYRWVNKWIVIPVFNNLGKFITSYGLIIFLLTLIIKILLLPLTYKSYLSQAKMRLLKPEMEELNARYPKKEDAMKKQQAMMEMYKKAGVSPMGGCWPVLLQFPILIALFRFFPSSIELRGQSFLWAHDLSSYDSILNLPFNVPFYGDHVALFPLLMAVMIHISGRISMSQQAMSTPQMGTMKFMSLYLMPLMMLFWFNNYASGLSYYYTLSTLITILQTYGFRYIVNDEKLHARMKENAKKPKKKSKWQARYEDMMNAQQQQTQQAKKGKR
ncbi:MAG: membrane protein insertase YidC [Rikenellaceae bacterium]|nr:membrane protein insertase YidC [Rikenellaceae bacterium]